MEHQEEQLRQQQPELELASVLYKPCLQDQQVDNSGRESDAMSIDQCQTIREMDDSQLLGAATATNTGKADEASREGGCLVDVEVKHEVKAEAKVMETNTGKRRRGRPPRSHVKPVPGPAPPPRKKKDEEDVCFICFDGGSLVLCDRRGCPKAYHPACIKRDESFFRSKAKWNCGWHICSNCQKASHYLCYTCTYSVCKGCVKDADYLVVRGNKGFCGTCMRTVMLIENAAQGDKEMVQVDFDDKSSWEYLFKVYWLYLKGKLSLTLDELTRAKNPWKGAGTAAPKLESLGHLYDHNDDRGSRSNNSYGNLIANHAKKRKTKIQPMFLHKVESLNMENSGSYKLMPLLEDTKWATKELLEFVAHMRNGDTSMLSQYDVQFLLLEYVKRNSLRDPHQKCQIVCDSRLTNLFGKERVGHFEMLKLLESHFLIQENFSAANTIKRGVLEAVSCQVEADRNNDFQMMGNDKKRKTRKKFGERGSVTNPDDYAAIDVHNINLIYLSRNLMENLIDDTITFHDKVVGSIVRIRISGSDQKQDMYRLVQVVGTSKAAEPYSVGSRTIDIMLEILNLDKKEVISIDGISNQEFSEDECRRLRQSIKCGLIKRLTVGEIREKAMALQAVRVNDGLEAEILRLNHLRDRASEKGHRKELREYVEKLELLNSPEERRHRLREIPEVHGDPNMDPSYESEEDGVLDLNKRDNHVKGRCSGFCKNEKEAVSSRRGGDILKDTGNRAQKNTFAAAECSNGLNAPRIQVGPTDSGWNNQAVVRSEPSGTVSEGLAQSHFAGMEHPVDDTEVDKIWHYQDPTGKVQGPFSMFQLRKWSTSGHFPPELRIWRINEKQDGSILLTDALNGQYHKDKLLLHDGYLSQQEVKVPSNDQDINNLESRWSGSVNAAQVDSKMLEVRRNSMRDDATANSIGNNDFVRNSTANDTSANSSTCTLTADVGNSNERQTGSFVSGWNSLKSNHSLPDQPQVNSSLSSPLVSGNPCGILSHEVRKDPAGERWNTGQSHATEDSPNNAEHRTNIEHSYEKQGDSEGNSSQSCGQNWKAPTVNSSSNVWDLNCSFVCLAKSLETSKQNQDINFPDLPSPTPKSSREDLGGQAVEMKQSVSSSVVVQDSGISWSTASSLVGGARVREVAGEWSGYSPTPSKPSVEEWDATAAPAPSAKPVEMAGELATTPTSGCAQVTHSSPSHPPSNASDWPAIVAEPNECDESVSDLLAEVEAMESLNGLPSPTSILHCGGALPQGSENDCFSPVEELSPACDLGKSDALSSTNDFQMPSQSTITGEQLVLSHAAILDPQKVSGGSSSTNAEVEEDTKPSDVSTDQCEAGSDIPPPGPPVTSWEVASTASAWRVGSETTGASWGAVQGNANLGWGGLAQANSTLGWGAGQGTAENASMSSGIPAGNPGVWGSQPRYAGDRFPGPRDRDFQGRDSSFGRGRSFWNNRQSSFGGAHGVGSSRPLHKGQRVCKFHESGHCKKGASCSFWHP